MSKWIIAKDKLPEVGQLVIILFNVDFGFGCSIKTVDTAMWQDEGFIGGGLNNFLESPAICQIEVTHWMPLPEPPKEENNK